MPKIIRDKALFKTQVTRYIALSRSLFLGQLMKMHISCILITHFEPFTYQKMVVIYLTVNESFFLKILTENIKNTFPDSLSSGKVFHCLFISLQVFTFHRFVTRQVISLDFNSVTFN